MELFLHQWGDWPELYRNTDKTEATEIVIIDSQMNYRGKLDTYHVLWAPPRALYFFEKMRYTIKHHLWRCSQALRRGACKPLIPVFNSGHRLQPSHSCTCRSFFLPKRAIFDHFKDSPFLQNGLACDSKSIGIRIAIVAVALPFSNETHTLSDRIPRLLLLPAAMMCILVDSLRLEYHQHDRTGNNECTAQP